MSAERVLAVARHQIPDQNPRIVQPGNDARLRLRDGQRNGAARWLPLLEQRARLQVVHNDEVGRRLVQLLGHHRHVGALVRDRTQCGHEIVVRNAQIVE